MQSEPNANMDMAVMEEFGRHHFATIEEIAIHLACDPERVRRTSFAKRVMLARISRDPSLVNEFESPDHLA